MYLSEKPLSFSGTKFIFKSFRRLNPSEIQMGREIEQGPGAENSSCERFEFSPQQVPVSPDAAAASLSEEVTPGEPSFPEPESGPCLASSRKEF